MPVIAICSSVACDCRVPLQNPIEGTSVPTPSECPDCGASPMIALCPSCGFLLVELPGCDPLRCQSCRADIRAAFQEYRQGRVH
jgi:hypothetical protein